MVPGAVIFDMDGVLIDSEPLWRIAMIKGFAKVGIHITEDDCRKTQGTRFKEVVAMWLRLYPVDAKPEELETSIVNLLLDMVRQEGKAMPAIPELLDFCHKKKWALGLATSSSKVLMDTVVDKLAIREKFTALVSAEKMKYGKPHPEVFLDCAKQLNVAPESCLVIEDSVNGVIAAKAAQMKVIAVPDPDHRHQKQFALADYVCLDFMEALGVIKAF